MLGILFLVVILTVSSLSLVAHVNQKQQKQNIMVSILVLAAGHLSRDIHSLKTISQLLDTPLTLTDFNNGKLGRIEKERLRLGGHLQHKNADGSLTVKIKMHVNAREYALIGTFNDLRSAHIRGAATLIRFLLQREQQTLAGIIEYYSQSYAFPMRILNEKEALKFTLERPYMTAPNHVARYALDGSQGHFFTYIPEAKKIIELGPVMFQQSLSIRSVLVVMALAMVLAGISVYWLVHRFELNLQRLERASSRIAAGHLNSRVKVASEDAFGRLGGAFKRMAEQIQRLMGGQKEMIRAVSHELRTPVARMRFGIQMLEDSTDDQYLQKQVRDMDQDLQELDELVDEILTYARLEEGGPVLDFSSANLLDLIDQVVDETRRRTDKVDIHWHSSTTIEEHIFSDIEYRYMHRALQNLVGNACRYGKKNVHIEFSFDNDICRIDVEDDGEGIPEKDWERVFSPFLRLDDSRTRASGGYGLGLSIVQRIIFWHSGKAVVGKSRWQGTKMSLLWPKQHF